MAPARCRRTLGTIEPMNTKFLHGVAKIFESDVECERREQLQLDQRRQARLARQQIVEQAARLRDRIDDAQRVCDSRCAQFDRLALHSTDELYQGFATGNLTAVSLAERLAQLEAALKHRDAVLARIRAETVTLAETALISYESAHAEALKGVSLTPENESDFVPEALAYDFYTSGESSRRVKAGFINS